MNDIHLPVLFEETLTLLAVQPNAWYIDCTFGRGGHTWGILENGGNVLALDVDEEAISYGMRTFTHPIEMKRLIFVRENFSKLTAIVTAQQDINGPILGVLADFGVSSPQLSRGIRGFSFQEEGPLDMRMDQRLSVTAKDLVNGLGKHELIELLTRYGGEQHARSIAEAIVSERQRAPLETTQQLASHIARIVPRRGTLHPATKTFMALRMLVNDELNTIKEFLPQTVSVLASGGRIVTISFQEEEDRLVKRYFLELEAQGIGRVLTKKPLEPREEQVQDNPRSRSAKLRGAEKL